MARMRTATASSGYTILVIDDQEEILTSTRAVLERDGHHVETAQSGEEGLALFHSGEVQLVIVDFFMPGMTGEEVIQKIREHDQDVQIVLQTGYAGEKPAREMMRTLDIQGYHDKGSGPDDLRLWVDAALKAYNQHQNLVRSQQAIEAANQEKWQFLAALGYEIRTSLGGLLGMTELLQKTALSDKQQRYVDMADGSGKTLLSLSANLTDFADLEAGRMRLEHIDFDLRQTVEEMIASFATRAKQKSLGLSYHIHTDVSTAVRGDPYRLCQIIANLLDNALTYTQQGGIAIEIQPAGRDHQQTTRLAAQTQANGQTLSSCLLHFSVHDTGSGLAPEVQDQLFTFSTHTDGVAPRQGGGLGFGLRLSKQLAELMGGEIGVKSEIGKGSTFWWTVRLEHQTTQAMQTESQSALSPSLVADMQA